MSKRLSSLALPYICKGCRARGHGPFAPFRAFTTARKLCEKVHKKGVKDESVTTRESQLDPTSEFSSSFPRWQPKNGAKAVTARQFCSEETAAWDKIGNGEVVDAQTCTVYGRVISRRSHGSKLLFLDISSGGGTVQVLLSAGRIFPHNEPKGEPRTYPEFAAFRKTVKRGDYVVVTGHPNRAAQGQITALGIEIPQILSPSLEVLPLDISNPEVRMRNRHIETLVHPSAAEPLIVRHRVLKTMRNFLERQDFVEVSTPLIVAGAGGAAARPFETYATEFSDTKLNLRVAPELWLKRLIIGGMDRVYEIGPAFRNEGVDNTHNPEFTICEFYRVMTTLDELIAMTEALFHELAQSAQTYKATHAASIPHIDPSTYSGPYARLEFIPTLERQIQIHIPSWACPDLTTPSTALPTLLAVFTHLALPIPTAPTVPTLLDALASHLIEPLCTAPTFITHHPECTSPLAKSFALAPHPATAIAHRVAARAELFIAAREYVNCYEEENSPVAQRGKFERQLEGREEGAVVDEGYLGALEWGMPPTGGWGCGVDRMVMLFSGRGRIADVLPFGTLRNVVGLRKGRMVGGLEEGRGLVKEQVQDARLMEVGKVDAERGGQVEGTESSSVGEKQKAVGRGS